MAVSQDGAEAWAVRADSPKLLEMVNTFILSHDFEGLDARAMLAKLPAFVPHPRIAARVREIGLQAIETGAGDAGNRDLVLREMTGVADRRARFRCVLALARGAEEVACFSGAVEGRLTEGAVGQGGFGYDPLFIPEGYDATFGVLPARVKNALSHRARALAKLITWLADAELTGRV